MAFAASHQSQKVASWGDKYATVSDVDEHPFNAARDFRSDGLVQAVAQADDSVAGDYYPAPYAEGAQGYAATAYFYDLEGASFVYDSNTATKGKDLKPVDGKSFTQTYFGNTLFNENSSSCLGIAVVEQSYVEKYADDPDSYKVANAAVKVFPLTYGWYDSDDKVFKGYFDLQNWTIYVETSEVEGDLETDQPVTIKVKKIEADHSVPTTPTLELPDLQGTVAQASATVKGQAKEILTANLYMDSKDSIFKTDVENDYRDLNAPYDGATHTVVCDTVPGYTAALEVYDVSKGKYEAADPVTIKDVQEDEMIVRIAFTDNKTKEVVRTSDFEVNLVESWAAVGFDSKQSISDTTNVYNVPGAIYDPQNYITVTPYEADIPSAQTSSEYHRALVTAANEANKAAVEANKAEIMSWFNDSFDIEPTPSKANPNRVDLEIKAKNLSAKEIKALEEKYEVLLRNLRLSQDTANLVAQIALNNDGVIAPEIEFNDTPTKVTYKFKTIKKKSKSFTVNATASNNAAVTYKLINAPGKIKINKTTGQVTVTKGLKKGTYKIKVKAYLTTAYKAGNGAYYYPSETHAITVKVKK
jgi:hypothetical protein